MWRPACYNNLPMQRGRSPKMLVVEEYFEVERILCRRYSKGNTEYLVKWKGFEESEATWESVSNLESVLEMVLEFENQLAQEQLAKDLKSLQPPERSGASAYFGGNEPHLAGQCVQAKPGDFHQDQTTELREPSLSAEPASPVDLRPQAPAPASSPNQKLKSSPRVLDNTSIDISYEAKQIETRFQKLAEKCEMGKKGGKKKQKQAKRERKTDVSPKKSQRCPSATEIILQNDPYNPVAALLHQNSQLAMQLRERKERPADEPPSQPPPRSNPRRRGRRPNQDPVQGQANDLKGGASKSTRLSIPELEDPQTQTQPAENTQMMAERHVSALKESTENKAAIAEIRMLENLPNRNSEYLVQFDSGAIKIFKTVELIISRPVEFAEYLGRKHKV